jgi:hypothetical protein
LRSPDCDSCLTRTQKTFSKTPVIQAQFDQFRIFRFHEFLRILTIPSLTVPFWHRIGCFCCQHRIHLQNRTTSKVSRVAIRLISMPRSVRVKLYGFEIFGLSTPRRYRLRPHYLYKLIQASGLPVIRLINSKADADFGVAYEVLDELFQIDDGAVQIHSQVSALVDAHFKVACTIAGDARATLAHKCIDEAIELPELEGYSVLPEVQWHVLGANNSRGYIECGGSLQGGLLGEVVFVDLVANFCGQCLALVEEVSSK